MAYLYFGVRQHVLKEPLRSGGTGNEDEQTHDVVLGTLAVILTAGLTREVRLGGEVLATIYGGQPGESNNGMRLGVNKNCQYNAVSCTQLTREQCENTTGEYVHSGWAYVCVDKLPTCPTCHCTEYPKDYQGNPRYCVEFWWCYVKDWGLNYFTCERRTVEQDPDAFAGGILGNYSVGANCTNF